ISSLLAYLSWGTYAAYRRRSAAREQDPTPPEGWYQVVSVTRDGKAPPALRPDDCRWKSMSLRGGYGSLRFLGGSVARFRAEGDLLSGPASLVAVGGKKEPSKGAAPVGWLSLTVTDGRKARLKGVIGGHGIEAELQRENRADFPLMSRGFRWISEE